MIDGLAGGLFGRLQRRDDAPDGCGVEIGIAGEANVWDEQDVGWVSVYIVWDAADAVVIVARLQDEGIPALARPEAASSAIPVTAGMMGEIEVLVPEAMADHAIEVLWKLGLLPEQDEPDEYEEDT